MILYIAALAVAPLGVSANNQFFFLCSIEHKRKNWLFCDTVSGADASAIIYSITETAKANGLRPYYYLEYVLSVLPEHMEDKEYSFIEDLLPWSENLPEECRRLEDQTSKK